MTKSKITIAIRFHLLQVWPSELRFFVFSVSLIHSFNVLSVYFIFLCFIEFGGSFYPLLNFNFSGEKKKKTDEPLFHEVLGITNDCLCLSNSKIYEEEPRYNEISLSQTNFASSLALYCIANNKISYHPTSPAISPISI